MIICRIFRRNSLVALLTQDLILGEQNICRLLISCFCRCEITIYVTEQSNAIGTVRRVPAFELHRFMQQQNIQQQLKQQICMESCLPRVKMTEEQIRNILINPPSGVY